MTNLNNKIYELEEKINSLNNFINKQNIVIKNYKSSNDPQPENIFASLKPGEKPMAINFLSMGCQDIMNHNELCKNTELFVKIEERLYKTFPQYKDYETYFVVNGKNGKRIKRFKTLDENNIKTNDIICVFKTEEI